MWSRNEMMSTPIQGRLIPKEEAEEEGKSITLGKRQTEMKRKARGWVESEKIF